MVMDNMNIRLLEAVYNSCTLENDATAGMGHTEAGKGYTEAVALHRILHVVLLKCSQMV